MKNSKTRIFLLTLVIMIGSGILIIKGVDGILPTFITSIVVTIIIAFMAARLNSEQHIRDCEETEKQMEIEMEKELEDKYGVYIGITNKEGVTYLGYNAKRYSFLFKKDDVITNGGRHHMAYFIKNL